MQQAPCNIKRHFKLTQSQYKLRLSKSSY
jgi:hypothetical protein